MKYYLLIVSLGIVLFASEAAAAVKTQTVEYRHGDTILEGYLAYDDTIQGKRPGVLVIHNWLGLQNYAKKRTEQLAKLGYVAFAVDVYGKGIRPTNPKDCAAQAGLYKNNRPLLRERVLAGLDVLRQNPITDTSRIAAIGYCFGGTAALELARSGADIRGIVSFHGNLDTPNPSEAKNIKAKILVLHGADDPYVPAQQVLDFQKEMREAKTDWQIYSYGGAVHSFTEFEAGSDPSKGAAYHEAADKRSWEAMQQFFSEIF